MKVERKYDIHFFSCRRRVRILRCLLREAYRKPASYNRLLSSLLSSVVIVGTCVSTERGRDKETRSSNQGTAV